MKDTRSPSELGDSVAVILPLYVLIRSFRIKLSNSLFGKKKLVNLQDFVLNQLKIKVNNGKAPESKKNSRKDEAALK